MERRQATRSMSMEKHKVTHNRMERRQATHKAVQRVTRHICCFLARPEMGTRPHGGQSALRRPSLAWQLVCGLVPVNVVCVASVGRERPRSAASPDELTSSLCTERTRLLRRP